MKIITAVAYILLVMPTLLLAQTNRGTVTGTITSDGQPVAGANIVLEEIQKGTASDSEGQFSISGITPDTYNLTVSAVGFSSHQQRVIVKASETVTLDITLTSNPTELGQIVVTGTMRETFVKESPVKVTVVSSDNLQRSGAGNLMESIDYLNGLYQEVSCGVCGTNSVRINGMDGPYTAVLIDGMPVMGALASVYGLNGINQSTIRNIEIIKGPNSTLYGSEAMGGVINILTRNPADAPRFSVDASASSHQEMKLGTTYSAELDAAEMMIGVDGLYFDRFLDHNDDGFADVTRRKKLSLFNKWSFDRSNARTFDLVFKLYLEDRIGGTEEYTKELRGSDEIYGESIGTQRFEMLGRYDFPWDAEDLRADFSYSYHKQNSYYGTYHYEADQQIYFTNLIWDKRFTPWRQLLVGATSRIDALDQTFDDIRLEQGSRDVRFIPGLFAQYEHTFSEHIKALAGMRIDQYDEHGLIYSPRLNAKVNLSDHTTLRLNGGTGFRIVNLFTEEHEALTGSREVVIEEELHPERSINGTLNLNQIVDIGLSVLNIDLDLFYTRFSNQIIPDYSQTDEIRYHNLDGYSVSRGISLNAAHNFPAPFQYSVGVTWQDVFQSSGGAQSDIHFAPDWSAVFTATYTLPDELATLDYTGRLVGQMKLPDYPGYTDRSELFSEHNIRISRTFSEQINGYLVVKNIGNYTQKGPIIAPDRPFSDDFETDHVYGPLQTRRVMAGIKVEIP